MKKVMYSYYKDVGASQARGAITASLRNGLTKYVYLSGHGDPKRIYWGELEEIMITPYNVESALRWRDKPPIFSEVQACDSMTSMGAGTWSAALTKNFSPKSCVIGYRGMGGCSVELLTEHVWPAVYQFYYGILHGVAFYPSYAQAIADHTEGDMDPSEVFKFAGDESPDFRLPQFNPAATEPLRSYQLTAGIGSITLDLDLSYLGDSWNEIRCEAQMGDVGHPGSDGWMYREEVVMADKPGLYRLPLENLKPGGYWVSVVVSNSYHCLRTHYWVTAE